MGNWIPYALTGMMIAGIIFAVVCAWPVLVFFYVILTGIFSAF